MTTARQCCSENYRTDFDSDVLPVAASSSCESFAFPAHSLPIPMAKSAAPTKKQRGTLKKRPAASGKSMHPIPSMAKTKLARVFTLFDQQQFIRDLASKLKMAPMRGCQVPWASMYDGSNMPAEVMQCMKQVLGVQPVQLFGSLPALRVRVAQSSMFRQALVPSS